MSKKRTKMNTCGASLKEAWACFIISKTSKCVSAVITGNGDPDRDGITGGDNIHMGWYIPNS